MQAGLCVTCNSRVLWGNLVCASCVLAPARHTGLLLQLPLVTSGDTLSRCCNAAGSCAPNCVLLCGFSCWWSFWNYCRMSRRSGLRTAVGDYAYPFPDPHPIGAIECLFRPSYYAGRLRLQADGWTAARKSFFRAGAHNSIQSSVYTSIGGSHKSWKWIVGE